VGVTEVCIKTGKALMTNRLSFELNNKQACLVLCHGPTLWTPSVKKWSLYEKGKKFEDGVKTMGAGCKKKFFFFFYFVMATQVSYISFSFFHAFGTTFL